MWWKNSLKEVVDQVYLSNEIDAKEILKDWLVAYEVETRDKSLRNIINYGLVNILMLSIFRSKSPNKSYSESINKKVYSISRSKCYGHSATCFSKSENHTYRGLVYSFSTTNTGAKYVSTSKSLNYVGHCSI